MYSSDRYATTFANEEYEITYEIADEQPEEAYHDPGRVHIRVRKPLGVK